MNEIVFEVMDAPEGGYTARALGASIYTEADTLPDLRESLRDAVRCHFEDGHGPAVIRLHHVREEVITS
ncbi:MAG: 2-oxoisovalerate dehydrogenase [Gemmatimonadetes bacterium]|nr:2-oxoisovalerate dehydrogenase [Gemmatimonadota bacterium]